MFKCDRQILLDDLVYKFGVDFVAVDGLATRARRFSSTAFFNCLNYQIIKKAFIFNIKKITNFHIVIFVKVDPFLLFELDLLRS